MTVGPPPQDLDSHSILHESQFSPKQGSLYCQPKTVHFFHGNPEKFAIHLHHVLSRPNWVPFNNHPQNKKCGTTIRFPYIEHLAVLNIVCGQHRNGISLCLKRREWLVVPLSCWYPPKNNFYNLNNSNFPKGHFCRVPLHSPPVFLWHTSKITPKLACCIVKISGQITMIPKVLNLN